MCPETHYAEH